MSDDLPPATPENCGGDKTAANPARDERNGDPDEKFKLTQLEWGGFSADFYVVLWVWSDLISCHDIKRIWFLLAAIFVAHGVLCYFVSKLLNSWRWALFCWLALSVAASSIAYKNSLPEKQPPHFKFSFLPTGTLTGILWLTNKSLTFPESDWGKEIIYSGCLGVPVGFEQKNVPLRFGIQSSVFAEDIEVMLRLPDEWNVLPDPAWRRMAFEASEFAVLSNVTDGVNVTNELQSLAFILPNPLYAEGAMLPPVLVQQIPTNNVDGAVSLIVKAKGMPSEVAQFSVIFVPTAAWETNAKPFIGELKEVPGQHLRSLMIPWRNLTNENAIK